MPNIVALILAAGQSKRFGSPKQLLKWKSSNLLENAIKEISELSDTDSVYIIRNDSWEQGLGNSIAFGVNYILNKNIKVDGILLMLADQPLIDSDYLNSIIEKFKPNQNQIVASSYLNGKKGVPALFNKSCFEELTKLQGDTGAKALIENYSKNVTLIKGGNKLDDIDTLEDYKRMYNANHL